MKFRFFLTFFILGIFWACQGDRPDGVLSKSDMRRLLYDYHLAQGLGSMEYGDSADYKRQLYIASVFKKHGITAEDFEKNLRYYATQMDEFYEIYKDLSNDFGENGDMGDIQSLPQQDNSIFVPVKFDGEMTNNLVLTSHGLNRAHAEILCDSTFQECDEIELQMRARALYPEGEKSSTLIMTLHYEGDSTQVVNATFSGFGLQSVKTQTSDKLKLKNIHILLLQNASWLPKNSVLAFDDIRMKIKHQIREIAKPTLQNDSIPDVDSVKNEENLKKSVDTLGHDIKKV